MKCPKCGHEASAGDMFCSRCGTKLETVCPECGSKTREGDLFCSKCGAKLAGVVSDTPPKLEDMQKQLQDRIPQSLADKLFVVALAVIFAIIILRTKIADFKGLSNGRELCVL